MGLGFQALIWKLKCPVLALSPVCVNIKCLCVCASVSGEDFHQQFYRSSAFWVVAAIATAPARPAKDILALWGWFRFWFRSQSMVPGFWGFWFRLF